MTKKEALQKFFAAKPKLVALLKQHRDGLHSCREKATLKNGKSQTVKNQQSKVVKIFGVRNMDEAARHAAHYGIIDPPPEASISKAWSEDLRHYHRKYIEGVGRVERKKLGIEPNRVREKP